jgi:hypothetical protein
MGVRGVLGLAAVAVLVAGCFASPAATPTRVPTASQPAFSVSNGTTIPVAIAVNGAVLETVPPGATEDPVTISLPPRPWAIEARSPSGRVLLTLAVSPSDPLGSTSGRYAGVDLACGRVTIWAGAPTTGGPTFIPDPSKPCD